MASYTKDSLELMNIVGKTFKIAEKNVICHRANWERL